MDNITMSNGSDALEELPIESRYWSPVDKNASAILTNQTTGISNQVKRTNAGPALVRSSHAVLDDTYVEFIIETSSDIYTGPTGAREVAVGIMDAYPKINNGDYQYGSVRNSIGSSTDGICVYFPSREIVYNGQTISTLLGFSNRIGFAVTANGDVSIRDNAWAGSPPPDGIVTLSHNGHLCLAAHVIHPDASATIRPNAELTVPQDAINYNKGLWMSQIKQVNLSLDNMVGVSAYSETGDLGIHWSPHNEARVVVSDPDMPLSKAYRFDHSGYIRSSTFTLPSTTFDLQFYTKFIQSLGDNTTATILRLVGATHYLDVIVGKYSGRNRFGLRYREFNLAPIQTSYAGTSHLSSATAVTYTDAAFLTAHHFMIMKCNDGYMRLCVNGEVWSSGIYLPDFEVVGLHYGLGSSPLTSIPYPALYGQLRLNTGALPIDAGQSFVPDVVLA